MSKIFRRLNGWPIEGWLGRALQDDENLTIRPAHVRKDAATGEERARAFRQYQQHLDLLGNGVKDLPEAELDAAMKKRCKRSGIRRSDSNARHSILVRATNHSTGPARRLLDLLAWHPDPVIALSPFRPGVVGRALSYPRMQLLFNVSAADICRHVDFLRSIARIVEPRMGLPVVLHDPSDDPVIYTAIAAGADILLPENKRSSNS